jgi:chemotaxis protein CheX
MNDFNQRYLDFCRPFIEAIKEVYSTMISSEVSPEKPAIKTQPTSFGYYSAIMGINGRFEKDDEKKSFKGTLVLSWPEEVYLKTASAMLMEEYTEYNDEIADVGLEICNITMGSAKKVLSAEGFHIDMSIPTSVRGKGHEIRAQEGVVTISTPLNCDLGTFVVELSYEDFEVK